MKEITGEELVMWGSGIIGFGSFHYKYITGHEGNWILTGLDDINLMVLAKLIRQSVKRLRDIRE